MKCNNCGYENDSNIKYCTNCGKKLLSISKKRRKTLFIVFIIILILLIAGFVVFFTFFNPNNERLMVEGLNDYFDISSEIENIELDFTETSGYIKNENIDATINKVGEYAKKLYENGKIKEYNITEGTSVWMKFHSGVEYVYIPPEKGCDSSSIETYQPCLSMYDETAQEYSKLCVDGSAESIQNKFENYVFENNYDDKDVNLEILKSLGKKAINIWHGHGGYDSKVHSFIITGEELNETRFLLDPIYYVKKIGYTEDYLSGRIVCTSSGYIAVTSKFFDQYLDNINESIIYLGTCHSGQDDVLANVFISKGAQAVIANDETICTKYDLDMIDTIFAEMRKSSHSNGKYYTLKEALNIANDTNGHVCCLEHNAKVKIFGNDSFRLSDDKAPEDKYVNGNYIVSVDGKLICARSNAIYYKECLDGKEKKIAYAGNVESLLSDGETVYYAEGVENTADNFDKKFTPKKIYKASVNGSKSEVVTTSNGQVDLVTYENGFIYYLDITQSGDNTYQHALIKYDIDSDRKTSVLGEWKDKYHSYLKPVAHRIEDKIFVTVDNSLFSYDIIDDNYKELISAKDGYICDIIDGKVCFAYTKSNKKYISLVDSKNAVDESSAIPDNFGLQVVDDSGEYALFFNSGQSDENTMFDMYKFNLKTGEFDTASNEAGRYKNKNYMVLKDLSKPENIYFLYNVGLYDESQNRIVNKKHEEFEIDITKPMWIVDGYIVDWDLNKYKILEEDAEYPTTPTKTNISSDEAAQIAREKAGGDGYRAVYWKTVKYNGEDYYLINISWRVDDNDGKFHYSHIGYTMVSMDGKNVKNADYINDQVQVY